MKLVLYISRVEEVPDFFAQRSGTASTQKFKNRFHSYLSCYERMLCLLPTIKRRVRPMVIPECPHGYTWA